MSDEQSQEVVQAADGEQEQQAVQQALGWKTELPESIRGNEVFAPYKTKNDLWNGHIEAVNKAKDLEGRLANAILKPADDAPEDVKAAYRQTLLKEMGVPEKPEDYNLTKPADWPSDVPYDEALMKGFMDQAFKLGASKEVVEGLNGWYHGMLKQAYQAKADADKQEEETAKAEIVKEWGADYDKNTAIVNKVVDGMKVSDANREWLRSQSNPVILKMLLELAPNYLDDNAMRGSPATSGVVIGMNYQIDNNANTT